MAELIKSDGGEWWCDGTLIEDLEEWLADLPPATTIIVHLPYDSADAA